MNRKPGAITIPGGIRLARRGGVRGGMAYGATDEVGLRAVENKVHVRNFHATILHLLGLDHEALSFYHNGLERTTQCPTDDVEVVEGILA